MCDCEVRNHPGSRCGSVNCQCHMGLDEANAIVNDQLAKLPWPRQNAKLPPRKEYFFSISMDNIPELDAQAVIDAVRSIRGDLNGVTVHFSEPIGEDS